jgi:hypothetical protein
VIAEYSDVVSDTASPSPPYDESASFRDSSTEMGAGVDAFRAIGQWSKGCGHYTAEVTTMNCLELSTGQVVLSARQSQQGFLTRPRPYHSSHP